jgi:hypothetical protein
MAQPRGAQPGPAWYTPGRVRWLERKRRERERRTGRPDPTCRRCYRSGHLRTVCPTVLLLWTNGPDVIIAESVAWLVVFFNAPLGPDADEDLYTTAGEWTQVTEPLTVNGVTLPPEDWASLYLSGFLVVDGELAPEIATPRRAASA